MYEIEGHCTFSGFRDTFYTYYTLQFLTSVFTVAGFHSSLIQAKFVLYFAHYFVIVFDGQGPFLGDVRVK